MRVVAATFPERSQANAALAQLRRELPPADLEVAPFAHAGEPGGADTVLAGRFSDELAPAAVELVERAGGEVVADIDEKWTGLNSAVAAVDTLSSNID